MANDFSKMDIFERMLDAVNLVLHSLLTPLMKKYRRKLMKLLRMVKLTPGLKMARLATLTLR
jgi:phage portal protein BeeE